jgi:CubicO group peptidase (beta-lactamase class C family)
LRQEAFMKFMKLASCAWLVAALAVTSMIAAAPTARPADVGMSADRLQRLARMIEKRVTDGDIAGAVVAVGRQGRVVHVSSHGVADLESRAKMGSTTMFRIASMTKPVVSAAIMMMVEEGRIRLNDPVSRYIPEFRGMQVANAPPGAARGTGAGAAADAGAPRFDRVAAAREITVRDLLTHTSGLGSGPMGNSDIAKVARKDGERLADYIPRLGQTALEFQPGSRWTYSPGAGFETLGRLVEITSGMPLDQFFRTRIFEPLGMSNTTFWPSDAQWPRVATVYQRAQGKLTKAMTPNDTLGRNVYFRGSGGLFSTAEDYVQFGLMLAGDGALAGKRLLSRKSVEMIRAVHIPDTLPGRPAGEGYGLGVRVVTNHAVRGTMLSDGTYGWSGAQGTHFVVDPEEKLTAVLMVQTSIGELQRDFEDLVSQAIDD